MGAYLNKPVTEKQSESGSNGALRFGASAMQGWRTNQEDAHNCVIDFDGMGSCMFAVYDGHGGAEVAEYLAKHFPQFLRQQSCWSQGLFGQALEDGFLQLDEQLLSQTALDELQQMAKRDSLGANQQDESDADDDQEERVQLCQEARLPLEDVLRRYGLTLDNKFDPLTRNPGSSALGRFRSPNVKKARQKHREKHRGLQEEAEDVPAESSNPDKGSGDQDKAAIPASCYLLREEEAPQPKRFRCDQLLPDALLEAPAVLNGATGPHNEEGADGADQRIKLDDALERVPAVLPECWAESTKEAGSGLTNGQPDELSDSAVGPKSWQSFDNLSKLDGVNGDIRCANGYAPGEQQPHCASSEPMSEETVSCSSSSNDEDYLEMLDAVEAEEDEDSTSEAGSSGSDSDTPAANEFDDGREQLEEGEKQNEEEGDDDDDEDDDNDSAMISVPFGDTGDTPGVDSGTTACVAVVRDKTIYVANAGDSRCVLCRNGKAVDLSQDHKPEDPNEKLRIEKAGGSITPDGRVNGGLNLSRAIGDHFYKRSTELPLKEQMITALPDIRVEPIQAEDQFFVVACDGIWNSLSSQDVVDFVQERMSMTQPLDKICEELCDMCLAPNTMGDGTGCDNMTVIVVSLAAQHPP